MIEILMKEVGMKKAVIIVLVVCMLTGAAFSSPVPLVWMFLKDVGISILITIGIGIGEGLFGKEYTIVFDPCEVTLYPSGTAVRGIAPRCMEVEKGMSECSVLGDCIPTA